ncbi:hypothetical protein, partial [Corynebacterium belfantii]|uniref:hypothetical protein n=1 Tax=Corynebacterium belfantii TaxID=2014537 RepID=UPI001A7E45EA
LEYAVGAANAAARAVGLPHAGEDAPLRDKIAFRRCVGGVQWTGECPIVCVRGAWFTSSPRIGRGKPRLVG